MTESDKDRHRSEEALRQAERDLRVAVAAARKAEREQIERLKAWGVGCLGVIVLLAAITFIFF